MLRGKNFNRVVINVKEVQSVSHGNGYRQNKAKTRRFSDVEVLRRTCSEQKRKLINIKPLNLQQTAAFL